MVYLQYIVTYYVGSGANTYSMSCFSPEASYEDRAGTVGIWYRGIRSQGEKGGQKQCFGAEAVIVHPEPELAISATAPQLLSPNYLLF